MLRDPFDEKKGLSRCQAFAPEPGCRTSWAQILPSWVVAVIGSGILPPKEGFASRLLGTAAQVRGGIAIRA